jgi:hypothetical protein
MVTPEATGAACGAAREWITRSGSGDQRRKRCWSDCFFKAPIRQCRVSGAGAAQLEKDAKT